MPEVVQTTLQPHLSADYSSGGLSWASDGRAATFPAQYVRLYGTYTHKHTTSGSLVSAGAETEAIDTFMAFTGGREISLSHANPLSLSYSKVGDAYDSDGNVLSGVVLSYDATSNKIMSNKECIAAVRVVYTAKYSLFKFLFSGGPCKNPPQSKSPYNPSVLIALNAATGAVATTNMSPPDCPGVNVHRGEIIQSRLKLEVDPKRPPQIRKVNGNAGPLFADCDVRVYPNTSVTTAVNLGTLTARNESGTQVVTETLTFSGSGVSQLSYQPAGSVSLQIVGSVTDQWGSSVLGSVKAPHHLGHHLSDTVHAQ